MFQSFESALPPADNAERLADLRRVLRSRRLDGFIDGSKNTALTARRSSSGSDSRGALQALEDLAARPTVNIEGLVGGYTGEGGKTVLPHRATAKLDFRLVPDMTRDGAVAKLKAYLAKRGYGDIEVNVSGGYDPTTTAADSALIRTMMRVYQAEGIDPIFWPRRGGSWPGFVFTGKPLSLPAAHFGLGHGQRAHAPDEYYLIESSNPKLAGIDGAVRSFVNFLYALA